ncbi:MAG: site-specific DNA-methyltransferase [Spirochaetaceae bacterium]|nr:site-specific DNA-methyltransferase [Spirochaetaceae bacterium]
MRDTLLDFSKISQINLFNEEKLSVSYIKELGAKRSEENLDKLIILFAQDNPIDIRREIVSSIGRQLNKDKIYNFIHNNVYSCGFMELVYQMFRTCLYNNTDLRFLELQQAILKHFDNEVLDKMQRYYTYRQSKKSEKHLPKIVNPLLLKGDNVITLPILPEQSVQLIFSSPPYYNARLYADYKSYNDYLSKIFKTLEQCFRVLEDGRFIIINVSPVITKRPGREFESIRYPIHFDFHKILEQAGFYFIDEIIWIKPEYSVPNRVGGYHQTRLPLSYKPNCITESLLVYRKAADFLLDKNIKKYPSGLGINKAEKYESTNCWYIQPKADKNHPAVFPEELCEKVLTYYSFPGDVVLDPFAGSGTFGRVATQMERIPVLCEQNEKYINIIQQGGHYDNL